MINMFSNLINQMTGVVQAGMVLGAIAAVGVTFFKSRSLVATATSIFVASLALWFVFHPQTAANKLGEDIEKGVPTQDVGPVESAVQA